MAKINQTISNFPTAPDSSTDSAPVFNTKANAFVGHQSGVYVGEVNTWATEANALRDDVNNIVATIPVGTIDDGVVASDKVWSSQQTDKIAKKNTPVAGVTETIFDSGLMIITEKMSLGKTSNIAGKLYRTPPTTWVYQSTKPFISQPTVSGNSESANDAIITVKSEINTKCLIRVLHPIENTTIGTSTMTAIGYWK